MELKEVLAKMMPEKTYLKKGQAVASKRADREAKEGVVLIAHKTKYTKLAIPTSVKKIFEVDDHLAITASGLVADARKLIDIARITAQRYYLTYNEKIPVQRLAKDVADVMQVYTQYGGIRPFGVSLLVAGVADGGELYEIEPSGAMTGYYAVSIGNGKKEVDDYLEKNYKIGISEKQAIKLGISALKKSTEETLSQQNLEVCVIRKVKGGKVQSNFLSADEVGSYL